MADESRPCGLYRATDELREHPGAVTPSALVYFHNHSEQGPPIVVLPEANTNNKWTFGKKGYSITDPLFIERLEPLRREGLYRVREHFHPDAERVVPANALVQLGYNRAADPIIFFPRTLDGENALVFPTQGMRIPATVYELLEPLDLRGPHAPEKLH